MEFQLGGFGQPIDYTDVIASTISADLRIDPDPWHIVLTADQLAPAIHAAAMVRYPDSDYSKLYGKVN